MHVRKAAVLSGELLNANHFLLRGPINKVSDRWTHTESTLFQALINQIQDVINLVIGWNSRKRIPGNLHSGINIVNQGGRFGGF